MNAALAVTILQAIATTIIGAIALYFARMQALTGRTQALTNQNEFRLRFFDRRFAVYDAVMEFSAHIAGKGSITQEELREYVKKMREASFFFNDEIQASLLTFRVRLDSRVVDRLALETPPRRTASTLLPPLLPLR